MSFFLHAYTGQYLHFYIDFCNFFLHNRICIQITTYNLAISQVLTVFESLTDDTLYPFLSISVIYFKISFDNVTLIIKNTSFQILLCSKGCAQSVKITLFLHYFSLLLKQENVQCRAFSEHFSRRPGHCNYFWDSCPRSG